MKINTCIFDYDGTLADTTPTILATAKETQKRLGFHQPSDYEIRSTIGLPLGPALQIQGKLPDNMVDEAVRLYREIFFTFPLNEVPLFPGVAETIAVLEKRGIRMAVATSRSRNSLIQMLEAQGILKAFTEIVAADDGITAKPEPDMVLAILERFGSFPSHTMVIGDTTFDVLMGSRAHCHTCGVTYGNHTREQLATASPEFVVESFDALLALNDVEYTLQ